MAEEYGIRLKVTADTAEAKSEIDSLLDEKRKRVQDAVGGVSSGSSADGKILPDAAARNAGREIGKSVNRELAKNVAGKAIGKIVGGVSSGKSEDGKLLPDATSRNAGREIGKSVNRELAKSDAGKAIGKAIAGFALHQGLGTAFGLMREPGGNNVNLDRGQATVQGAVQYGMMGAMVGGPAGAAIGSLVGGLAGIVGQLSKERENYGNVRIGNWQTALGVNESVASGLGAIANQRILAGLGGSDRLDYLSSERKKTYDSLVAARSKVEKIAKGGDTSSTEYMYAQGEYGRLSQLYGQKLSAEMQERLSADGAISARDFSDSMSARGLSVGPQVDVASVNAKITESQGVTNDLLRQLVDLQREGAAADGSRLAQALHEIKDATSL